MKYYNGSPHNAIITLYREHPWRPWKFLRTPRHWWQGLASQFHAGDQEAIKTVRSYLEDIGSSAYSISSPDQWMQLGTDGKDIERLLDKTTQSRLAHFGSLLDDILPKVYPSVFTSTGKSAFFDLQDSSDC